VCRILQILSSPLGVPIFSVPMNCLYSLSSIRMEFRSSMCPPVPTLLWPCLHSLKVRITSLRPLPPDFGRTRSLVVVPENVRHSNQGFQRHPQLGISTSRSRTLQYLFFFAMDLCGYPTSLPDPFRRLYMTLSLAPVSLGGDSSSSFGPLSQVRPPSPVSEVHRSARPLFPFSLKRQRTVSFIKVPACFSSGVRFPWNSQVLARLTSP